MASQFIGTGLANLQRRLDRLSHPDYSPLLEQWERVIVEDNRRGVMAGLDRDGNPLPPVRYRDGRTVALRRQKGGKFGTVAGRHNPGGSLTSAQYRQLTGPPLAPRGLNSRVITNLHTGHGFAGGVWFAVGEWFDVTSSGGVHFLPYHFAGRGRLPIRDLRGVRPQGRAEARALLREFVHTLLRG